jgi:pimeloyl-[acyl-carrier protein] synthase
MIEERSVSSRVDDAEYDLTSPTFFAAPEQLLRRMRERAPVYWHAPLQAWVITRYHDVQFAIRDKAFSNDRGGTFSKGCSDRSRPKLDFCDQFLLKWMVFADPPRHTVVRGVVTEAFSPQVVESLRGSTAAFADELLLTVQGKGKIEVVRDFALPLPALVTGRMLGLPGDKTEDLKRWSFNLFRLFGAGIASDEVIDVAYENLTECKAYFEGVIEERRSRPGDDLISRLVATRDRDQSLSEDELTGLCGTLMAGAYETTTHLITNGLFALMQHHDQLQLLREQPNLIDGAVEEFFRYIGPALSIVRRAKRDVELGGKTIREGENVFCMLHAANHDPTQFSHPERFDIQRPKSRHLGLGFGPHFCLGAALTRLETRLAIQKVLAQLPGLTLDRATSTKPTWLPNLVIRGLEALHLEFSPDPIREN